MYMEMRKDIIITVQEIPTDTLFRLGRHLGPAALACAAFGHARRAARDDPEVLSQPKEVDPLGFETPHQTARRLFRFQRLLGVARLPVPFPDP